MSSLQASNTAIFNAMTPQRQQYVNKVKDLYATYKPEHFENSSAEKVVENWPPGQEEERYQALLQKYAARQPSPLRAADNTLAVQPAADGTLQLSPTAVYQQLNPFKQQYVKKVRDTYPTYDPARTQGDGAEKLVQSWPDGQEEGQYQKFLAGYQNRSAQPAINTAPSGVLQQPSQAYIPIESMTPRRQEYVHKVTDLYAAYKPDQLKKSGAAARVVQGWPEGQEEEKYQALLSKYVGRQPSPERNINNTNEVQTDPNTGLLKLAPTNVYAPAPTGTPQPTNVTTHRPISPNTTMAPPIVRNVTPNTTYAQPYTQPTVTYAQPYYQQRGPTSNVNDPNIDPIFVDPPAPPFPRIVVPNESPRMMMQQPPAFQPIPVHRATSPARSLVSNGFVGASPVVHRTIATPQHVTVGSSTPAPIYEEPRPVRNLIQQYEVQSQQDFAPMASTVQVGTVQSPPKNVVVLLSPARSRHATPTRALSPKLSSTGHSNFYSIFQNSTQLNETSPYR